MSRSREDEDPLGSVGVPCCDHAKLWRQSFGGIRQITLSELRRQHPLALLRAKHLRTLLQSIETWEDQDGAVEEALKLLASFESIEHPGAVASQELPLVAKENSCWLKWRRSPGSSSGR